MSKLVWDQDGERRFETGVDEAILFPLAADGTYAQGVAWSGITAINEKPSGAEATKMYADNRKYGEIISAEEFAATLEAYTYPDEFKPCVGEVELAPGVYVTQQTRTKFGLAYRTLIGNDVEGIDYAYERHLVYGASAAVSETNHESVNESPEAGTFSWEISTTPVDVPGKKPSAHIKLNSKTTDAAKLAAFEKILLGDDSNESRLPLPAEIATIMGSAG